jgi:hypothetical protein
VEHLVQEPIKILPYKEFSALFAAHEKDLRNKKKRMKTAPTEALQREIELLTRQVKQMRLQDKFYLVHFSSGPQDALDELNPLLPRLRALPLAWLWQLGVKITKTPEGVTLSLVAKGSFKLEPGLLAGVFDVLEMRFHTFETTATGADVDEALKLAEHQIAEEMKKHPDWSGA